MRSHLAEHLIAARRHRFIGRTQELKLFQSALAAPELPFHILHIYGPGGVGKTTLLEELIRVCEQHQTPAIYLDARNTNSSPEFFLSALRFAMGLPPLDSPLEALTSQAGRHVLLIDTYERIESLDEWLREAFLPQLPANTLTVLAGRHSLASPWRADPGWQALTHILPLRNLTSAESQVYLVQRNIPPVEHQAVLDFTYGHPLALSLVADVFAQEGNIRFQPAAVPDVIRTLLETFIQQVPSSVHYQALEACALIRLTNEALLAQMLDVPDVREWFQWLRDLSFIESGRLGLFPHDLAREVLIADLRWRNPDWYAELHERARAYYTARLEQTQGHQQHILFDYTFLHRDNSAVRPYFTWQDGSLRTDTLRERDRTALIQMVAQHEGEASAQLAAHWLQRQPQGVLIFRDAEQQPAGFFLVVALHQANLEDRDADPAAKLAWRYLQERAPLRPGEGATLLRFWMARDTYQVVSPIQSLIFINFMQHHRSSAGLAFTFFPCAEPDFWAEFFAYADLARIFKADFEVGDRLYGVYGHDWRVVPFRAWQALLAQREIAASAEITPVGTGANQQALLTTSYASAISSSNEPLVVLSQPDFVEAVRAVLRNFSRPNILQGNPLLQSRLVTNRVKAQVSRTERVAALQALVREAAESLRSSPREAKYYRAVYHTYLHPAPTQERAAELLDLPFSTFRRHLKAGVMAVTSNLWSQEIN